MLLTQEIKTESVVITGDSDREFSRALITGITGFVGRHLVEYIRTNHPEVEIHGIIRHRSNVLKLEGINLHYADLNDFASLSSVLQEIRPDVIFHLAAQAYVDQSFKAPLDTLKTNVVGTCNLLEAIKDLKLSCGYDPIIHICSSSEEYGQVSKEEVPIKESNQFRPASPYAVSKCGEDLIALQYYLSWKLKTIRTRAFTHSGTGRGEVYFESSFAKQIAEIEKNKRTHIEVGNLDSVRSMCDVRDMVRAYWLAATKGDPGEVYNIGGDEHMTVGEYLQMLIDMSLSKIEIRVDQKRLRPSDVTLQIPDTEKFREKTGWLPRYSAKETMADLLNFWRVRV